MSYLAKLGLIAAVLGAPAAAGAADQPHAAAAPVPIVVPRPPALPSAASSTLASTVLAIWQAQNVDPQAAQAAAFAYLEAVQQYRWGNAAGARTSVLRALAVAGAAQVGRVTLPPPVPATLPAAASQLPGTAGGLYGGDAPVIDADTFLALARGAVDNCAAHHDPRTASARRHQVQAARDFAAGNWEATRVDAKAAIDACAKDQP